MRGCNKGKNAGTHREAPGGSGALGGSNTGEARKEAIGGPIVRASRGSAAGTHYQDPSRAL